MSRRTGWAAMPPAWALLAALPALAQDAQAPVSAGEAVAAAEEAYGPVDARARDACPPQKSGGEIVVCAPLEEQSQFRVQSSGDLDPAGAGARGGVPRAPDVGTVYPGIVVARGCFIPPCPPPMPSIIDLKAIPEAPPGSDADRVGRGLAPTGRNDPITVPAGTPGPGPAGEDQERAVTPPG